MFAVGKAAGDKVVKDTVVKDKVVKDKVEVVVDEKKGGVVDYVDKVVVVDKRVVERMVVAELH